MYTSIRECNKGMVDAVCGVVSYLTYYLNADCGRKIKIDNFAVYGYLYRGLNVVEVCIDEVYLDEFNNILIKSTSGEVANLTKDCALHFQTLYNIIEYIQSNM